MKLSPILYNYMKETLIEKANKLREEWKQADEEAAYECGVKYADAQRALDFLEEAYTEFAAF